MTLPTNRTVLSTAAEHVADHNTAHDILNDLNGTFGRAYQANVLDHGAVGDGTTDDTAGVLAAITAAGVGGTVLFPPGKTFLVNKQLTTLAAQTWLGYGAKIKRAPQVVTTTATAITTGTNPTTFAVASTAGLAVGMAVTVTGGANASQGCYVSHPITGISGLNVTVSGLFTKAFPAGGSVVTHHGLISTSGTPANVRILGLEIDGNRANNTAYTAWQTNYSVYLSSDGGAVRDCYIHDSQADGVIFGGAGAVLEDNRILSSGGNAIHLSGLIGGKVKGNYCKDATLAITGTDNTTGPDHAEGLMTWSSTIADSIVTGNHFENGRAIFGGIGSSDNSNNIISDNTCIGATLYAIEWRSGEGTGAHLRNLLMVGNRITNCVKVAFDNNQTAGEAWDTGNEQVTFACNELTTTYISVLRGKNILIEGNRIDYAGETTLNIIDVAYPFNVKIIDNVIVGGRYGIYVTNKAGTGTYCLGGWVDIRGNTFRNQWDAAINYPGVAGYQVRGHVVAGNQIIVDVTPNAGYVAIVAHRGLVIQNNYIDMIGGTRGINASGDDVASPAGVPGTIIRYNTIRTESGKDSVRIFGGDGNSIVEHNDVLVAVNNGQPANNRVASNTTFTAGVGTVAGIPATDVSFTPAGGIAATTVQAAVVEVDAETVKLTGAQTVAGAKTFTGNVDVNGNTWILPGGSIEFEGGSAYMQFKETADPAGAGNRARLYCRDNGSGKTQLCVQMPTGAVIVLATEA